MFTESPPVINQIHTACKNCIFATYQGTIQTGCKVDRLEKYKKQDPSSIIEVYDEEKDFFVVNNRYCLYYRNYQWAQKYEKRNIVDIIRKEMKIKYHAIIVSKLHNTLTDIKLTIDSIAKQEIKPKILTIINRNPGRVTGSKINNYLNKYKKEISFWRIENAINLDLTDDDYVDIAIDGTKQKPYTLYFVIPSGKKLHDDFCTTLDRSINDDLLNFHLLTGEVLVVPKMIHLNYGGNSFKVPLQEKLETDLCDTSKIIPVSQICPV